MGRDGPAAPSLQSGEGDYERVASQESVYLF